jgi:ammonium transporter, Amt family
MLSFLPENNWHVNFMSWRFLEKQIGDKIGYKNVENLIFMKSKFSFLVISGTCYWLVGYSLAFGSGSSLVGLGDFVVGTGLAEGALYSHWFFQFTFAATAATIVSGAVAERCSFASYLTYSAVISGSYSNMLFIY